MKHFEIMVGTTFGKKLRPPMLKQIDDSCLQENQAP